MSTTQDIILHWYPESPFSQKLAWILNYKKVEYKVVLGSRIEPRPLRRPLDGGYRKTPILQIGNHVYCDTKAAILELEKLYPEQSVYPKLVGSSASSEGLARGLSMWIDTSLFMNTVSQIPVQMLTEEFVADRTAFAGRSFDPKVLAGAAPFMKAPLRAEFNIAEKLLDGKTWLLDTESPSLADFSLAMTTFFALNLAGDKWVKENIESLYEHMSRLMGAANWDKTETAPKISAEEAIEVLKRLESNEPSEDFKVHTSVVPLKLGQEVAVTPLDTGKVPSTGTLIRSTVEETVIAHKDAEHGTTSYIHFPTTGFIVVPHVKRD